MIGKKNNMSTEAELEAQEYNFNFLREINNNYHLYGNGCQRLVVPLIEGKQTIAYVIKGCKVELLSWDAVKAIHPRNLNIEKLVR